MLAPIVGGALPLHSGFAFRDVLLVSAATLAVDAIAWIVLATACVRWFGGIRLREFSGAS